VIRQKLMAAPPLRRENDALTNMVLIVLMCVVMCQVLC
jgi:hypothetical protein